MSSRDGLAGAKGLLDGALDLLEEPTVPVNALRRVIERALHCVENSLGEDDAKRLAEADRRRTSRGRPPDVPPTNAPRRATARTAQAGLGGGEGGDLVLDLSGSLKGQASRGSRAPASTDEMAREWCVTHGIPDPTPGSDAAEFLDFWTAVPGPKGTKLNWSATWRVRLKALAERRRPVTSRFVRPLAPGDELSEAEKAMAARKAGANGR